MPLLNTPAISVQSKESQREAKPPLHNEPLFFFEENIKGVFKRGVSPSF